MWARDWKDLARELSSAVRPSIVVIALGVNDATLNVPFDRYAWLVDYLGIVSATAPARVVPVGVMPMEGRRDRSPEGVALMNAGLERLPRYIPPFADAAGLTHDGLHLNRKGQRVWHGKLAAACGPGWHDRARRRTCKARLTKRRYGLQNLNGGKVGMANFSNWPASCFTFC